MKETIPIPAIHSYNFSFDKNRIPAFTEWTEETKRIAGMYGIALGLGHGRLFDIAANIFDIDTAECFAKAAKKHQDDTEKHYGYTNPVFIVNPSGEANSYSFGRSPGQQ